jgi:hypothetical protein
VAYPFLKKINKFNFNLILYRESSPVAFESKKQRSFAIKLHREETKGMK